MLGKIIFALDDDKLEDAVSWVERLKGYINWFKIGPSLFTRYGPISIESARKAGAKRIFLDLKWNDIPTIVLKGLYAALELGVDMVDVHLLSGEAVLIHCQEFISHVPDQTKRPLIFGVSILSSLRNNDLFRLGFSMNRRSLVVCLARLGYEHCLDGVIASGEDIGVIKRETSNDFLIVCPGVYVGDRKSMPYDQKNTLEAKEAFQLGADFVVLGRSFRKSKDPLGFLMAMKNGQGYQGNW